MSHILSSLSFSYFLPKENYLTARQQANFVDFIQVITELGED